MGVGECGYALDGPACAPFLLHQRYKEERHQTLMFVERMK